MVNNRRDELPLLRLDFFYVGDGDWAVLFEDAAVWIFFRLADGLLDDAGAFDDDLAFGGINGKHGSLLAFVVTGDDFDGVAFCDVGLDSHGLLNVKD